MNGSPSVWTRPRSYWDVVGKHLPLALISGMALLVAGLVPLHLLPIRSCTFLNLTDPLPGDASSLSRLGRSGREGGLPPHGVRGL